MQTRKIGETYRIDGADGKGLIPKGAMVAFVDYDDGGEVKRVRFNGSVPGGISGRLSEREIKGLVKDYSELNSRELTAEEMVRVVEDIKKFDIDWGRK